MSTTPHHQTWNPGHSFQKWMAMKVPRRAMKIVAIESCKLAADEVFGLVVVM